MPTPAEQAAEESVAGGQSVAGASVDPSLDDTNPIPVVQAAAPEGEPAPEGEAAPEPEPEPATESATESAEPADSVEPAEPAGSVESAGPVEPVATADAPDAPRNRAATTSLIAGILGVTAIGAVLGLVFGGIGLVRSRSVHTGKVRAWIGIILSLLWVGAFVYVAPHIIEAADPGCTAFKEKVLPHYNQAIDDLDTRAMSNKTTADLAAAVAGLAAAAAQSKNPQARNALRALTRQLRTASNDQIGGQIPASVMVTLNHDAVAADNACGTI